MLPIISWSNRLPQNLTRRALKPKERKVQQIELDEYLRPVKFDKNGKRLK